jgi:putative DNA primase/helicase
MGSFLRGFNRDKRFSVWYGHGNGGKSKFMDLVCSTLGLVDGYAVKFPLDTLLEGAKKSAGAASPEIDQGRGAFLAVLDEPKKGQKFDAGKIKAITGNDAMYTRTLFSKGGSFRPMFKTVLLGNVMPKADYDMAMKIRFWVWWFKGRFADPEECPPTREEQDRLGIYPLDKDLDNKLPQYKSAMLSLMLHYYELYCKEGIKRTENIRKATDMFWNSANDVLCFLSEQTVQSKETETYVPVDDLYDAFRRWFMNRNNGDRVMTKIVFQDELEAIYTNQKIKEQGGLAGIRLRDGV